MYGINQIVVIGNVVSKKRVDDELWELEVCSRRLSGNEDIITVLTREEFDGCIKVYGQMRSRQCSGLKMYVYAESVEKCDEDDINEAIVEGYVCKPPYSKAVGRRYITTMMLAVNGRRCYYIPVVCWGITASEASRFSVGDRVAVTGRYQTRQYRKDNEQRTATELSVIDMQVL